MSFINFEGTNFTFITDDKGEPWFLAKELCEYLGLKDAGRSCKHIPDCNKQYMVFDHLKTKGKGSGRGGDNGRRLIVNEPGIYRLIGRSRKLEAEEFQRWLFHGVAPSIHKKGSYSIQPRIEALKAPPQQSPRRPKHTKRRSNTFFFKSRKTRNLSL